MSDEELHVHLIPELLSEIASLRRQITEARAKAIEDAAKVTSQGEQGR
jgi:DNA-binding transcriptional regulator YdaS (Cro superfamily)